ncbi:MAG: flagellar FliJ family protein [Rhodospirillales bacterium]
MTRTLTNLIRLHRWRVDEYRRAVTDAGRRVEHLTAALAAVEEGFRREQEKLHMENADPFGYGIYVEHIRMRRRDIRVALAAAEHEMADLRRQLADAYRECRKFELVKAERDRVGAAAASRREQRRIDEAAATLRRLAGVR